MSPIFDEEPTKRVQAGERTRRAVVRDWQVAKKMSQEESMNGTEVDLAAILQHALVREIGKHCKLLRKASIFPAGFFQDASRGVLHDGSDHAEISAASGSEGGS